MQSGASVGAAAAAVHGVAAAALHLAARVAGRVGQLEVLLDVVDEAVDDVAVPEEGLVLTAAAATVVVLLISLRRHDQTH